MSFNFFAVIILEITEENNDLELTVREHYFIPDNDTTLRIVHAGLDIVKSLLYQLIIYSKTKQFLEAFTLKCTYSASKEYNYFVFILRYI